MIAIEMERASKRKFEASLEFLNIRSTLDIVQILNKWGSTVDFHRFESCVAVGWEYL